MIPLIGDIFDMSFACNLRNAQILEEVYMARVQQRKESLELESPEEGYYIEDEPTDVPLVVANRQTANRELLEANYEEL